MSEAIPLITYAEMLLTTQTQLSRSLEISTALSTPNMSIETAKSVVDFLASNGASESRIPSIKMVGGEPLLLYDEIVKPLVSYIRTTYGTEYQIVIETNGILLDEKRLSFFKENRVIIDFYLGGNKEAHDLCMPYMGGESSYSAVISIIPLLLKYFPLTRATLLVTPGTSHLLSSSLQELISHGFLDVHVAIDMLEEWNTSNVDTLAQQLEIYKGYVLNKFDEEDVPIVFGFLREMFCKIAVLVYETQINRHRGAFIAKPNNRDGVGYNAKSFVDSEGRVFSKNPLCDMNEMSHMYIGTINDGISTDLVADILTHNNDPVYSSDVPCSECPLNAICTGGNIAVNYTLNGNFIEVPSIYCKWSSMVHSVAMDIVRYFDKDQTNTLFKDWFYGVVTGGVHLG